jgi:hypothetical protein
MVQISMERDCVRLFNGFRRLPRPKGLGYRYLTPLGSTRLATP